MKHCSLAGAALLAAGLLLPNVASAQDSPLNMPAFTPGCWSDGSQEGRLSADPCATPLLHFGLPGLMASQAGDLDVETTGSIAPQGDAASRTESD